MTSAIRYMTKHGPFRKQKVGSLFWPARRRDRRKAHSVNFQFRILINVFFFLSEGSLERRSLCVLAFLLTPPRRGWLESPMTVCILSWTSLSLSSIDGSIRSTRRYLRMHTAPILTSTPALTVTTRKAATLLSHNQPGPPSPISIMILDATGTGRVRQLPSDVTKH